MSADANSMIGTEWSDNGESLSVRRWRRAVTAMSWFSMAVVVYVLSYAPYLRWRDGRSDPDHSLSVTSVRWICLAFPDFHSPPPVLFRFAEWLIDQPAFELAHYQWAGLWRVKIRCEYEAGYRAGYLFRENGNESNASPTSSWHWESVDGCDSVVDDGPVLPLTTDD